MEDLTEKQEAQEEKLTPEERIGELLQAFIDEGIGYVCMFGRFDEKNMMVPMLSWGPGLEARHLCGALEHSRDAIARFIVRNNKKQRVTLR